MIAANDRGGFSGLNEYFTAVRGHGTGAPPNETNDPKLGAWLDKVVATAGDDEQSTFSDPSGGFLVPPGLLTNTILSRSVNADPLAGRTTFVPMPVNRMFIPYRVDSNHTDSVSGGFQFHRREESATGVLSRGEIGLLTLQAKSLIGLTYASVELPKATAAALIEGGFEIELPAQRLRDRIHGSGVGEPRGVLTSPALITVPKADGQGAGTFLYQNAMAMTARCWGYDYDAVWLVNPELRESVYTMNAQAGAEVWSPPRAENAPGTLLGRPLFFNEEMSAAGSVGDVVLMCPKQYLDGEYQPLETITSLYVRFVEHQRAFKIWARGDGCPWWDASLTPKNGTNTLSPYVTLAARA